MNIEYIGKDAIVTGDNMAYTFQVSESPRDFASFRTSQDTLDWVDKDYHIGDWRIHPYGDNNNLPKEIQRVIQANSDAPGMLKRKSGLLWGKGPKLYREAIDKDNQFNKMWTEDKDVQKWLDSWDYEGYLMKSAVDFSYIEGSFSKAYINRGVRIGKGEMVSKLEHVSVDRARLASLYENATRNPTHIVVTDFSFETLNSLLDMKVYPIFDFKNPFKYKNAIYYSNMYSFCADYYTVPDIYGTLEWIRRSNAIPLILKALSKNSINLSYHVVSPQEFWDQAEERLKNNCGERGITYNDKMLADYEQQLLKGVSKVLSSEENTGKFWHTKKSFTVDGTNLIEHGWEIKPIDQKLKDFVKAQVDISDHSSLKISTSIGVHSAISGSGEQTKVNSGSEQNNALQNYLLTQNDIPESIVMKMMNYALRVNFPEKNLKMGFYHVGVKKLQDTTPSERPLNQNPN
ncbi:hypothetical protein [Lutibacter sp.]|uniref:hypothetical protein n=1 Tax=Lutibacter sp. TaxID=1925666 RepID=UPI00356AD646